MGQDIQSGINCKWDKIPRGENRTWDKIPRAGELQMGQDTQSGRTANGIKQPERDKVQMGPLQYRQTKGNNNTIKDSHVKYYPQIRKGKKDLNTKTNKSQ